MKPIIIVMLCVQAAILVVTFYIVAIRKPTAERPGPVWSSIATSLLVVGIASNTIAQGHVGKEGADIIGFVGAMLIGMAVMGALMLFSEKRDRAR
jgi:drug/metabolite transporter (DMT)-like permease